MPAPILAHAVNPRAFTERKIAEAIIEIQNWLGGADFVQYVNEIAYPAGVSRVYHDGSITAYPATRASLPQGFRLNDILAIRHPTTAGRYLHRILTAIAPDTGALTWQQLRP